MVGHDLYGGMTEGGVLIAKIPKCSFLFFREYSSCLSRYSSIKLDISGTENYTSVKVTSRAMNPDTKLMPFVTMHRNGMFCYE